MSPKYRPNVAVLITDGQGQVLLCYRGNSAHSHVQTVQGGIDPGETPEEAATRELYEEVGIMPEDYRFIAASEIKYRYEWPRTFLDQLKHKTYIGQEQQFFLIETKSGVEFKLDTHEREFESVRWGTPQELVDLAWEKKRPGLENSLKEFGLLPSNA
jgi:putative (di)nucleoside polyphosphate hydrolase